MNTSTLVIGTIFSAIGAAYFMYGRKQQHIIALLSGVVLCVLPFAIDDWLWLGITSLAAAVAPFVIRL